MRMKVMMNQKQKKNAKNQKKKAVVVVAAVAFVNAYGRFLSVFANVVVGI